jgi:DNA end-binding protein Ku
MRAIWKGAITFGLVSIPVKLYSATEERDVAFHQVRRADGARIRYKRVAAADGEEVPYADIAKGYELPGGEIVVLTDEDFANLPLSTSRAIDVLEFVPLEQVDPIYFAKSYYLEPDRTGAKPYALLRDALEHSGRVALVKIAIRSREQLGTLRVRNGVFVLETMLWPDEVRTPDFAFLDEKVEVRPQELAMAESLIATLAADFDPSQYRDSYREALQAVIDAKVAGKEVVPPSAGGAQPDVAGDLMAALKASVAAARRSRGELPPAVPPPAPGSEAALGAAADTAPGGQTEQARAPASAGQAEPAPPGGPAEPATGTTDTVGPGHTADSVRTADAADTGDGESRRPPRVGGSEKQATKPKSKPKKSVTTEPKAATGSKRRRTA